MNQTRYKESTITALGHDGFLVEYNEPKLKFAFDPFEVKQEIPVDYIFISHPHYDHCDSSSVRKMITPKTKIIAPSSCQKELIEFQGQLQLLEDKEKHAESLLTYWAISAYNINKFRTPTEVFHPKEIGGVGFIVEVGASTLLGARKTRFYHAGDTDITPEMEGLKKIDVAFLPISGTFVMTIEEAMKAAELIQPEVVIPMHFGKILGSVADANRFQNLLRDKIPVTVLSTDPFS